MPSSKKIIEIIKNPSKAVVFLSSRGIIQLRDETYLRLLYKLRLGKKLDLDNPKAFNEKLQWLKLRDRKRIYTTLVDKYAVKKYIADTLGKEYIIPTIGIYNGVDEIDFERLPGQFVIKCTHDSGGCVVCKDKKTLNIDEAKATIQKSLNRNYYLVGREWPYKDVKPRIIIEKYIEDKNSGDLKDYKFFVFNGKVKCFKIDFDRFKKHRANYYDRDAKLLEFGEVVCPPNYKKKLEMPKNLKQMILLAEKLANNIPFVRIDFYEVNGKIYFGEITFYPSSGFGRFVPEKWDMILGDWLVLEKDDNSK